jgi:2-polyprenyl-6-methoxyphenol hydroxylase-like FAD-dependent oxidoreductase
MLSTILGQHGVQNIVLEREKEINSDPRGIALDEDGIRCIQACGIYDKIFSDIGQCKFDFPSIVTEKFVDTSAKGLGTFQFIGGNHSDLKERPFMAMNYNTVSPESVSV